MNGEELREAQDHISACKDAMLDRLREKRVFSATEARLVAQEVGADYGTVVGTPGAGETMAYILLDILEGLPSYQRLKRLFP